VLGVLEAKIPARQLDAPPDVALAVAAGARPLVVRLGVAAAAVRVRRKVQRSRVAGARYANMAFHAVDPLEHMRPMLEGSTV
jgi:hypothetical protein